MCACFRASPELQKARMRRSLLSLLPLLLIASTRAEEEEKKESELGTVIGIDLGTTYSW